MIELPVDLEPNRKRYGAIAAAVLVLVVFFSTNLFANLRIYTTRVDPSVCPVYGVRSPLYKAANATVKSIISDAEFRRGSVKRWSKAIQVDTQVFDQPPGVDESPETWAKFKQFHAYLKKTYPSVFEKMEVSTVNTYGLVFHWKGLDKRLKPLMLTAHQDTVPVQKDTLDDWTYPPFSGHDDGKYMYGRGSSDCKNVLVGIMDAVALLIEQGVEPRRGLVLAFGFDEEISGWNGAYPISQFLEQKFGKDSMYAIVDEGAGLTVDKASGRVFAMPGTCEKGYVDILAELTTPGGHSSVPPDHTSIGIMGELAYAIESDPFEAVFTEKNPTFAYMQCMAVHAGDKMPLKLRKLILRAGRDKVANSYVVKALTENLLTRYTIQTSQAIDIVGGGEKINALPENVKMTTNHRVAIESNVQAVKDRFVLRVVAVADKHNLGVEAFGEVLRKESGQGTIVLLVSGRALETAPRTPLDLDAWRNIAGVTRHIFEEHVYPDIDPVVVAPAIMTGNTDTRHYWNLTENIFRYSPMVLGDVMKENHIHSVDEKLAIDSHLHLTAWFYDFILTVDESTH